MDGKTLEYPAQINALTSIRYLAAAWVVLFHLKEFTHAIHLREAPIVLFGYLGVDFFFVLSGFVLTHVYKSQVDQARFDYWSFIAKRLGRIYPMHLFTLALFLVLGVISALAGLEYEIWNPGYPFEHLERGVLIRALMAHVTLIHAWGATPGLLFNLPSWSISAEWFAYLMFPVFMLLFRIARGSAGVKLALAIVLFLGMAAATAGLMDLQLTKMSWNIGILRIVPEFMLGVALYQFGVGWSAGRRGARTGLIASVLVAVAGVHLGALSPGLEVPGATLAVTGMAFVVFFAADCERHGVFPVLSNPFLVLLGEISYSVYMIHLLVAICVFELLLPGFRPDNTGVALGAIALVLAATTVLSWITYRLIEIPGRRLIVSVAMSLNRPPAPRATQP